MFLDAKHRCLLSVDCSCQIGFRGLYTSALWRTELHCHERREMKHGYLFSKHVQRQKERKQRIYPIKDANVYLGRPVVGRS